MDERLNFVEEDLTLTHVISEPGDATRYDFHYYQYYDEFFILPIKSSFEFPQKLNKYNIIKGVKNFEENNDLCDAADIILPKFKINPHTVVQTARAIYKISIKEKL